MRRKKLLKSGLGTLSLGIALAALALASHQFVIQADTTTDLGQGVWFVKLLLFVGGLLVAIALVCFILAVKYMDSDIK